MLKESATGIRVQSCEGDKIIEKERKEKRTVKGKLEELKEKGKQEVSELVDINIYHFSADSDAAACIYQEKNNRHNPKRRCIIYINYILIQIN